MNDFHYAVVVGINTYPGYPNRTLQHARSDAEAFAAWLVNPNGGQLPPKNVKTITATPAEEAAFTGIADARPNRDEVDQALNDVTNSVRNDVSANKAAWEESRLYLYVSGHGIAPLYGEAALVLANADEETLGRNIELSLYRHWYSTCGYFKEVVLFADCCREQLGDTPLANGPPFKLCPASRGQTLVVVGYAAALGGSAYEPVKVANPEDGRGYFTRAVLEALETAVDANGQVTSLSIGPLIDERVKTWTKNQKVQQKVEVNANTVGRIVFRSANGAAPPAVGGIGLAPAVRAKPKILIKFPAGFRGKVDLQTGPFVKVATYDAAQGDWAIDLSEGVYIVAPQTGAPNFAGGGLFKVSEDGQTVQL